MGMETVKRQFGAQRRDPLGIVALVRGKDDAFRRSLGLEPSSFYLKPCARCCSPVWQQPCPICDFYPTGVHDAGLRVHSPEWTDWATIHYRVTAFAKFKDCIDQHGNIATWYFACCRRLVAYRNDAKYRKALDDKIEEAKRLALPAAEAIWIAYGKD